MRHTLLVRGAAGTGHGSENDTAWPEPVLVALESPVCPGSEGLSSVSASPTLSSEASCLALGLRVWGGALRGSSPSLH